MIRTILTGSGGPLTGTLVFKKVLRIRMTTIYYLVLVRRLQGIDDGSIGSLCMD
jgi:hypothetical protein